MVSVPARVVKAHFALFSVGETWANPSLEREESRAYQAPLAAQSLYSLLGYLGSIWGAVG